jgi:hypothetical protein
MIEKYLKKRLLRLDFELGYFEDEVEPSLSKANMKKTIDEIEEVKNLLKELK